MRFTSQEDILALIEHFYIKIVETLVPEKHSTARPFPRIPSKEAMEKYGSDKPDIRKNKEDQNELGFCFVVDFPAFEWRDEEKRWDAVHHPFTRIKNQEVRSKGTDGFISYIKKDPQVLI